MKVKSLTGVITLTAVCGSGIAFAAAPERAAPGAALQAVQFDGHEGNLSVTILTTRPVPHFKCALAAGEGEEITLSFPGAGSLLGARLPSQSPLLGEVVVESLGAKDGSDGVLLHFRPVGSALADIEQIESGVRLRFVPAKALTGESLAYQVGAGDKLDIAVFGHEDLTKTVEVRSDGMISFPLVGDIPVQGKTLAGINADLTSLLGAQYLVDPKVSVEVREYHSRWVTLMGEIRTPGRVFLRRNMHLIDVLAEAGGVTKEAGSDILIQRHDPDGSGSRQITVGVDELFSTNNGAANVQLEHGDVITITERDAFYIRGEVNRPASYFIDKGMTVMKAITLAGGLTQFANRKEVVVLRSRPQGGQEKIIVNLKKIEAGDQADLPLQKDDNIMVQRRIF